MIKKGQFIVLGNSEQAWDKMNTPDSSGCIPLYNRRSRCRHFRIYKWHPYAIRSTLFCVLTVWNAGNTVTIKTFGVDFCWGKFVFSGPKRDCSSVYALFDTVTYYKTLRSWWNKEFKVWEQKSLFRERFWGE